MAALEGQGVRRFKQCTGRRPWSLTSLCSSRADDFVWCTVPLSGEDAFLFVGIALLVMSTLFGKLSAVWVLIAGERFACWVRRLKRLCVGDGTLVGGGRRRACVLLRSDIVGFRVLASILENANDIKAICRWDALFFACASISIANL